MINKDFYRLAEEDAESRGFNVDEVLACMERALIGAFKKEHVKWNLKKIKMKFFYILFIRL